MGRTLTQSDESAARRRVVVVGVAAVFLALAAGILAAWLLRPKPEFAVTPVRGKVTYRGKPVAGASVTLIPLAGVASNQRAAISVTDADGVFEILTPAGGGTGGPAGAQPGEYKVVVSKWVPPNGWTEEKYQQMLAQEATGSIMVPPRVELLPPDCSDPGRSKLVITVKPDEPHDVRFDIP
jgi:hypothetical protein